MTSPTSSAIGVSRVIVEDALHPVVHDALDRAGIEPRLRGWIALNGGTPAEGREDVDAWAAEGAVDEPDVAVGDDDPLRLMYTSGTESSPRA